MLNMTVLSFKKHIDHIYKNICNNKSNSNSIIPFIINYVSAPQKLPIWTRLFTTKYIFHVLKTYLYHREVPPTCLEEAALAFIVLCELGKKCTLYIGFSNMPVITFHAWVECEDVIFFEKRNNMQIIQKFASK